MRLYRTECVLAVVKDGDLDNERITVIVPLLGVMLLFTLLLGFDVCALITVSRLWWFTEQRQLIFSQFSLESRVPRPSQTPLVLVCSVESAVYLRDPPPPFGFPLRFPSELIPCSGYVIT